MVYGVGLVLCTISVRWIEACLQHGTDGIHPYRTELDYLLGCVMLDSGEVARGHCAL
jgi:hypothetical protein